MQSAFDHHPAQRVVEWMSWIGPVEPVIAVAPACDQIGGFELGQLILHLFLLLTSSFVLQKIDGWFVDFIGTMPRLVP
jgi:hypothetical protein